MICAACGEISQNEQSKFCHVCGGILRVEDPSRLPEAYNLEVGAPPQVLPTRRSHRKIVLVSISTMLLLGFVAGGVLLGARYKRQQEFRDKLQQAMGRDAGYTETILRIEAESSNVTFKELFDLCEKSISDRTVLIVEVRGLAEEIDPVLREQLVSFLNKENELVRSKQQVYRGQLDLNVKTKVAAAALEPSYSSDYMQAYQARRRLNDLDEIRTIVVGLEADARAYEISYAELESAEQALHESLKALGVSVPPVFGRYKAENLDFVKSTLESTSAWKWLTT